MVFTKREFTSPRELMPTQAVNLLTKPIHQIRDLLKRRSKTLQSKNYAIYIQKETHGCWLDAHHASLTPHIIEPKAKKINGIHYVVLLA